MKTTIKKKTDSHVTFTVQMDEQSLSPIVTTTYNKLRAPLKVAGFRPGKAPDSIVERELGSSVVQSEVLDAATSHSYAHAVREHELPVIASPEVKLTKFVPYTELEYEATAEILPPIKLADYKHLTVDRPKIEISPAEVDQVISDLSKRVAKRVDANRAAQDGDEVVIDFRGTKDGQEIPGAKATNYPLILGSNSFIPGFEAELVGLKSGDNKTFDIAFPKDYGQTELAGQKVQFEVKVHRVVEVVPPELNDAFAKEAGPYKNLTELKASIEKTILEQKDQEAAQAYENALLVELLKKSSLQVPQRLVESQAERINQELEDNLTQRKLTRDQYLSSQGLTAESLAKQISDEAKRRVEMALVLTEVAKAEHITVTDAEIEAEIDRMKQQYQDAEMRRELDRPETHEEIFNHLMAQRTIATIKKYNEEP